jgi:NAD-dependent dihydropyrimidine dehydrogenase PreA subunit
VHTYIYACVLMHFMYVEYMRPSQSQSDEKPHVHTLRMCYNLCVSCITGSVSVCALGVDKVHVYRERALCIERALCVEEKQQQAQGYPVTYPDVC